VGEDDGALALGAVRIADAVQLAEAAEPVLSEVCQRPTVRLPAAEQLDAEGDFQVLVRGPGPDGIGADRLPRAGPHEPGAPRDEAETLRERDLLLALDLAGAERHLRMQRVRDALPEFLACRRALLIYLFLIRQRTEQRPPGDLGPGGEERRQ